MLSLLTTLALFLLIIGVVILVHELGHFIAARATGMKVEEFAIGMGPKIWGKKRGDTEYMIKLFPIGGYVKILGEEERVKEKGSFSEKSVGARVLVAVAGVSMNFLLAVVIFYVVLAFQGFEYIGVPYYENYSPVFGDQEMVYAYPVTVVDILPDTPAEEAGLTAPVEIFAVDGEEIENTDQLKKKIENNTAGEIDIEIVMGESERYEVTVGVSEEGKIGVELAPDMEVWQLEYNGVTRVFTGFAHSVNMVHANVYVLGKLIGQSVEEGTVEPVASSVTGPIGLFAIIDIVKQFGGVLGLLDLVGLFCIALVIMNMLPFPALDGGHVVLLGIEAVRGRPVDEKVQQVMFIVGIVILLMLMAVISAKDAFQFGLWDWVKGLFSR
jgi:regulator of sigma E protease